jgi:hypothetical protein|tara:strand:- start:1443 stop:1685 length:243 start_codon:yes stop_codon:yes gene_type:complete
MTIKKQLDNLIIKKQVGFEIVASESERQQLMELFKQLETITKGQVKLTTTKSPPSDRGIDLNREPAILIAWIFENNPTQI